MHAQALYVVKIIARTRALRLLLLALTLTLAGLAFSATAAQLTTLSAHDNLTRTLGSYQAMAQVPAELAPGDAAGATPDIAGSDDAPFSLHVTSPDVTVDGRWGERFYYNEGDWDVDGQRFGLMLAAGRWPSALGEIAVSDDTGMAVGAGVSAFGGALKMQVVGVIAPPLPPTAHTLYAGSGTWETIDPGIRDSPYQAVSAQASLFSSQRATEEDFAQAIRTSGILPANFDDAALREYLQMSVHTADEVLAAAPRSAIAKYSFVFGVFAVLLPALLAGLLLAVTRVLLTPAVKALYGLGIPSRRVFASMAATVGAAAIACTALGLVLGVAAANAVRGPLSRLAEIPTREVLAPTGWLLLLCAATVAVPLVVWVAYALPVRLLLRAARAVSARPGRTGSAGSAGGTSQASGARRAVRFSAGVRLLAAAGCAGLVALTIVGSLHSPNQQIGLWAPLPVFFGVLAIALVLSCLPVPAPAPVSPRALAWRCLTSRRPLALACLVLLASTVGLCVFSSSLTASFTKTTQQVSTIAPGQVLFGPMDANKLSARSRSELARALGTQPPVEVAQTMMLLDYPDNFNGTFGIAAVASAADVSRLLPQPLTQAQVGAFERGELLVRDGSFLDGKGRATVISAGFAGTPGESGETQGTGETRETMPAQVVDFGPHWSQRVGAFIKATPNDANYANDTGGTGGASGAGSPDNPALVDFVLTGVDASVAGEIYPAAIRAGISPQLVSQYKLPEKEKTPLAVYLSLVAAMAAAALITVAFSRALAFSSAKMFVVLLELGLPRHWQTRPLAYCLAAITGGSLGIGIAVGLATLKLTSVIAGAGFEMTVDYRTMAIMCAATGAAGVAGIAARPLYRALVAHA